MLHYLVWIQEKRILEKEHIPDFRRSIFIWNYEYDRSVCHRLVLNKNYWIRNYSEFCHAFRDDPDDCIDKNMISG